MNRRDFLATAAIAAPAVLGANDRVKVGLIGCGGRGRYVTKRMRETPGVEFAAVADVYETNAASAKQWAGDQTRQYKDFRQLLEQKDLDAVLIATPDHWHATAAVLTCEAGKHVYVEKPVAHNVREGRAIVNAARKNKRLVQAGTQQRSATHFPDVAKLVQSGDLGQVRFVRVWNYLQFYPNGIGPAADSEPPAGLDWDFYLGPAPKVPFNPKRFLRTFRWFRDYAGGLITDFGTHRFDTVHQIMGEDQPRSVVAGGWKGVLNDNGDMPDWMQVTYEYPGFTLSYECTYVNGHGLGGRTAGMKYYDMLGSEDRPHGMAFYGTNGTVFADRIGYDIYPEPKSGIERKFLNTTDATGLHTRNFVQSVRGIEKLHADIEGGHRATLVGHLGNIAYLTGRKLHWDAEHESFHDDTQADGYLSRVARPEWKLIVS